MISEEEMVKERAAVSNAFAHKDFDLLPGPAKRIWQRMFKSAARVYPGADVEKYANSLAWRALAQKYQLGEFEVPPRKSVKFLGGTGVPSGGSFIVAIADNRGDALEQYEKVEIAVIPNTRGVSIRRGVTPPNHRQIIDIRIPSGLVTGEVGAVKWVRDNWPMIYRAGKLEVMPPNQWQGKVLGRFCKFHSSPEKATQQIGFGEVYVPWEVDLQGQYATEEEVSKFAYKFMLEYQKLGEMHASWAMPDGKSPGKIVESFLARRGDPDFVEGAWVLGVKFHDDVWAKVLAGEYRGYSIGGSWGVNPIRERQRVA